MSVRVETYLIRGVKLKYKEFNKLWNEWDNDDSLDSRDINFPYKGKDIIGKLGVIDSCMGGEYTYAGRCLGFQDDEYNQTFGELAIPTHYEFDQDITDWLISKELFGIVEDPEFKYYLITDWR